MVRGACVEKQTRPRSEYPPNESLKEERLDPGRYTGVNVTLNEP
jgi:hypothetical protein